MKLEKAHLGGNRSVWVVTAQFPDGDDLVRFEYFPRQARRAQKAQWLKDARADIRREANVRRMMCA